MAMKEKFRKVSNRTSSAAGSAYTFIGAITIILIWAVSGPRLGYSDTWQLIINTGTTIVTFLMVFLIQNTQNRDSKALHLKLDELIRSTEKARDSFVDLENFDDAELAILDNEFRQIHEKLKGKDNVAGLHKKINAERQRRLSLRGAGAAIRTLLSAQISLPDSLYSAKKTKKK